MLSFGEIVDLRFTHDVENRIFASFLAGLEDGQTFTEEDVDFLLNKARGAWLIAKMWEMVEHGNLLVSKKGDDAAFHAPTEAQAEHRTSLLKAMSEGTS